MRSRFNYLSTLFPIGLLVNSIALIIAQRTTLPDFVKGSFFGIGIGILLLPFFFKNKKTTSCR